MQIVRAIEAKQVRDDLAKFAIGDTVRVHFTIVEGKTERIQVYEGTVIAQKGRGVTRTFMVRKISYGVGVERIFPVNSPRIAKIEVIRKGRVRRAKLYYLRGRVGKAARVPELVRKKTVVQAAATP